MHAGKDVPMVGPDTRMRAAIQVMTSKGLGMTTVVDDDGKLVGLISDGDLRRLFERVDQPLDLPASQVMSRHPRTCAPDLLAARALELMEGPPRPIKELVVVDEDRRVLGVLKMHSVIASHRT
jgi:arabinose-5-phosphate isomerase